MNLVAGKAVAFGEALTPAFSVYTAQILKNAKAMEAVFKAEGIRLLCGGTDNHLLLADVFGSLGITGKEAEVVLDEVGMTLNKNMIADDPRSAMDPSGIRFGTPAMTTRGMKEREATTLAYLMLKTMRNKDDAATKAAIKKEVGALARAFPVPARFV
jgi:glycine hydroxymethyltransferase